MSARHPIPDAALDEIIDAARDLVSLWENPNIQALARADRNAAIEEARTRLIAAVNATGGHHADHTD